jgi:AdoMet-dependent heme synthase
VTSLNAHKLECIALFARSLGATVAVFNRYLGEADLPLQPTTSQLVTAVKMLNQLVEKKYPVKFGNCIPQCFLSNKSHGCLAGIALCTIDPWGNVRPCNHASTICGNLLQDSLETIWTGSAMQNWRAWLPETCRKCSALGECHGGCRAMATQGGDGSDPLLRAPLHTEEQPETHQFVLPKQACPHAVFEMKPEAFGYVLLRGNRIVPIAHEARPIIDSLDGNHSLEELERLHGNEAIQFIFSLWQTGLIEFT